MKKQLVLILLLCSYNAMAQSDTTDRAVSNFNATFRIGNFSSQTNAIPYIQGFAYNPYLSFGKKIKFNLGFTIIKLDTTHLGTDSLPNTLDNFELGLSYEQPIHNTDLYVGAGFNLISGEGEGPFVGNRVFIYSGYLVEDVIDLSIQAGRSFVRNPGVSGSFLMFGIGVRF